MKTCAVPTAKTCQIFQNHLALTSTDLISNLPSKDAFRQVITRHKKKLLKIPKEPTTFDFEVDEEAVKMSEGDNFIIKDKTFGSNKRVILFSTKALMTLLGQALYWIMDRTFKIVPNIFQQLYTVHGQVLNCDKTFPLLFVLLTHKDKTSYNVIFELLIEYCTENDILINPSHVILDFEKAAILSLRLHFESVKAEGCLFHFRQILYRKIQKEGLTIKYNTNKAFNIEIKCLIALYYIHPRNVNMYFTDILNILSEDARKIAECFVQNFGVNVPTEEFHAHRIALKHFTTKSTKSVQREMWVFID